MLLLRFAGSYYFAVGKYSVYQIGEVYCADPPPPIWAQGVVEKMVALYNACGVEVNLSGGGNEEIVSIAKQFKLKKEDINYKNYIKEFEKIFDKYSKNGKVIVPNKTYGYLGQVK